MTDKKQRPPNAPGPNGLRGGRNVYSGKTAIGNWIEDAGGSQYFKRGFTTDSFETEAQHQQKGRSLKRPDYYGANLPETFVDPRTTNDVFNPPKGPQASNWQTTTQSMLASTGGSRVVSIW